MTVTHDMIEEAAGLLAVANADVAPIGQLTQRYPGMELADAYAIRQLNLARRLTSGRAVVGHKIGLTSEPMQSPASSSCPVHSPPPRSSTGAIPRRPSSAAWAQCR